MADNLQKYKIEQLPDSIYYIPEFISESEETSILQQIYAAPKPKWTQLSNRRLQNWGGLPHPKGMISEKLPDWLNVHCQNISGLGIFDSKIANHVLINEYLPGQGIMPHTDGPLYYPAVSNITLASHVVFDFYHPITDEAEVNLSMEHDNVCADTDDEKVLSNTSLEDRYFASVLLQRRGLIVLTERAYSSLLHGIREVESDTITDKVVNLDKCSGVALGDTLSRSTRVSLTIRVVPKVLKTKLMLGKK